MNDHDHAKNAAKVHTIYKTADGKRVPGCTTITGILDKPNLKNWVWEMGNKNIPLDKYVDELASIGTLAHYMIECHCLGVKPDLSNSTPNQISLAENSVIKWLYWQEATGFIPEKNELILVSEKYRFGGTVDIVGTINGRRTLVDIKTSKGIFMEHKLQVAGGYGLLCQEHEATIGHIDDIIITRVGRNDTESFEAIQVFSDETKVLQELFVLLRLAYTKKAEAEKFSPWKKK